MSSINEDQPTLNLIADAVGRYAQDHNAYPVSLESLVPAYLNEVPVTTSGHAFIYDPYTGITWHPALKMQGSSTQTAPSSSGTIMDNYSDGQMQIMDNLGL